MAPTFPLGCGYTMLNLTPFIGAVMPVSVLHCLSDCQWRPYIFALTAILFRLVLVAPLQAQPAENEKQRFLNEAPRQWDKLQEFSNHLQGTITYRFTQNDKTLFHRQWNIKRNSTCKLILTRPLLVDTQPKGEVLASNAAYAFSLSRRTNEDPWIINGVYLAKDANNLPQALKDMPSDRGGAEQLLTQATWGEPLLALMKKSTFRILRVTSVRRGGQEIIQVDFDNSHPVPVEISDPGAKTLDKLQSGTLWLDPNRYWCVRSCDLNYKYLLNSEATVRVDAELVDETAEYPILKRWMEKRVIKHADQKVVPSATTLDFEISVPTNPPEDSDFTLTAFGLPEPHSLPPHKANTNWYVWFGILGLICLTIGAGSLWLRKRRTARVS